MKVASFFNDTAKISRRAAFALVVALGGLSFAASDGFARSQGPAEVPIDELMKPTDLPDITLGPADAKVTMVEYASMTCGHCQQFATTVLPDLKKKYVDTNKIRYIFREFPLDNLAAAAAMLARCSGGEKTMPMIDVLFEKQNDWAFTGGNPVPKLFEIAKQAGFTQESFDKCLTDQKLLDKILAQRTRASETFGVNSTPTIFINGKRFNGNPTVEGIEKMIDPLLEGK